MALRRQLAMVGQEKQAIRLQTHTVRDALTAIDLCQRLYRDGMKLRRAVLEGELHDPSAVEAELQREDDNRRLEHERSLLRMQERLRARNAG
ncbi:MAG: hypothetical protein AB2A00_24420 [Myxococcota bacterium]